MQTIIEKRKSLGIFRGSQSDRIDEFCSFLIYLLYLAFGRALCTFVVKLKLHKESILKTLTFLLNLEL